MWNALCGTCCCDMPCSAGISIQGTGCLLGQAALFYRLSKKDILMEWGNAGCGVLFCMHVQRDPYGGFVWSINEFPKNEIMWMKTVEYSNKINFPKRL